MYVHVVCYEISDGIKCGTLKNVTRNFNIKKRVHLLSINLAGKNVILLCEK